MDFWPVRNGYNPRWKKLSPKGGYLNDQSWSKAKDPSKAENTPNNNFLNSNIIFNNSYDFARIKG
jgi:hypothetical protein